MVLLRPKVFVMYAARVDAVRRSWREEACRWDASGKESTMGGTSGEWGREGEGTMTRCRVLV
jgi:hypothetical protein